jgi:hypothetical protein
MATLTPRAEELGTVETTIPARLDRLPRSRWHWRILIGLGTVWTQNGQIDSRSAQAGPRLERRKPRVVSRAF